MATCSQAGPAGGVTNALPSDPQTMTRGCSPTPGSTGWNGSGQSQEIRVKIEELQRLVQKAKGANSPVTAEEICAKIKDAIELAKKERLAHFSEEPVNCLLAEIGEVVDLYVKCKIKILKNMTAEATDDTKFSDPPVKDQDIVKAIFKEMKEVMSAVKQARLLGKFEAINKASAQLGASMEAVFKLRIWELMSDLPKASSRVVVTEGKAEEVTEAIQDVVETVKEAQKLGLTPSKGSDEAVTAISTAGQWLFSHRVKRVESLSRQVKEKTISAGDTEVKEAVAALLKTQKTLQQLGISVSIDERLLQGLVPG
jgi:hypothetical protein